MRQTNLDLCLVEIGRLGYSSQCYLLKSSWFGLPQSRYRIYILCLKKNTRNVSCTAQEFFESVKLLLTKMYIKPPDPASWLCSFIRLIWFALWYDLLCKVCSTWFTCSLHELFHLSAELAGGWVLVPWHPRVCAAVSGGLAAHEEKGEPKGCRIWEGEESYMDWFAYVYCRETCLV